MKPLINLLFGSVLVSSVVFAQPPELNQQQMQQLMQQAQQMQACMSRIDQRSLMAWGEKAQAVTAEIKSLCTAGQRDKALDLAIDFGRTMANDDNMKIAQECGEMARGIMPGMTFPTSKEEVKERHICEMY